MHTVIFLHVELLCTVFLSLLHILSFNKLGPLLNIFFNVLKNLEVQWYMVELLKRFLELFCPAGFWKSRKISEAEI